MISDLFLLKISDSWQSSFPWYYRLVIFIPLFLAAAYFGQKSHNIIFKEERNKLVVIKSDVYGRIRHPMYFGSMLTYLAFVVLSLSLIALIIFVIIIIFYYYLCSYEEKILIEKLGSEYKTYMKNVPMLFPKIKK